MRQRNESSLSLNNMTCEILVDILKLTATSAQLHQTNTDCSLQQQPYVNTNVDLQETG